MRDCLRCGRPVDGTACPHCGFGAGKWDGRIVIPCAEAGCNTPGRYRASPDPAAPHYCAEHYPCTDYRAPGAGERHPPPQGFATLRSVLTRMHLPQVDREPGQDEA